MKTTLTSLVSRKKLSLAALALLVGPSAFAGWAFDQIECASASGRTKLMGIADFTAVPAIDLKFSIDGADSNLVEEQFIQNTVLISKLKKGIFKIDLNQSGGTKVLIMNAVPKSMKTQKTENGRRTTFKAIISSQSTDPRTNQPIAEKTSGNDIHVSCLIVNEI